MKIRTLMEKDAPFMFEWLHDEATAEYLRIDSKRKTLEDCLEFIINAKDTSVSVHLAIVNDHDEYMGTVSLKNIRQGIAEFGIAIRNCAAGKGFASYGMRKMIDYGFRNLGIKTIYWCVKPENHRAIRFYEKNGYNKCFPPEKMTGYTEKEIKRYLWYKTEAGV